MNLDKRLLRQARAARLDLILTVGLGFLAGVVLVWQAYVLSQIIDRVFLGRRGLAEVTPLLLTLLGLSLARAGLTWAGEGLAQRVAGRVKHDLRQQVAGHLLALGPGYSRGEASGELATTAVAGIEALDSYFSQYLPQLALAALAPLTILVFVFPLDPTTGLVLLLTAPLIPLFMVLIGSTAEAMTRRQWTALSRMSGHFLDMLQGLTTLKLLGRSRDQLEVIDRISQGFGRTTLDVLRVAFLSALVLEMVATISTAVVAVEVGLRLLYGRLAFQQALFVLILAPEFYMPLRLLGARFHAGISGVTAARRIFEILDTPLPPAPVAETPPALLPSLRFELAFEDVYYAYDAGQRPALNGVSFRILPGQQVALVGPSGSGKSTITHLLLRFIEPSRGHITVDGRSLAGIDRASWRSQVAWVPQQPYLFHGSVAENIRLARPGASEEQLLEAARQADAHDFIQAMPQGYETLIGERGARLSGGQAQRLALARAFLKDAPFLILDEATANLDPETEARLLQAMARLRQGRTVLLVAHRLNTIYTADNIIVLAGGRVAQTGPHAELLAQDGLYRQLVEAHTGGGD
jgi:ATP-binding cassette subfamily C protein CydD